MYYIEQTKDGHHHIQDSTYYEDRPMDYIIGKQVYSNTFESIKTVKDVEQDEVDWYYNVLYTDDTIEIDHNICPIILTTDESLGLPVMTDIQAQKLEKELSELMDYDMSDSCMSDDHWERFGEKLQTIIDKQNVK